MSDYAPRLPSCPNCAKAMSSQLWYTCCVPEWAGEGDEMSIATIHAKSRTDWRHLSARLEAYYADLLQSLEADNDEFFERVIRHAKQAIEGLTINDA